MKFPGALNFPAPPRNLLKFLEISCSSDNFLGVLKCFWDLQQKSRKSQKFSGVYRNFLKFLKKFRESSVYSWTCQKFPEVWAIFPSSQKFSIILRILEVYRNVPKSREIFLSSQKFSGVLRIFLYLSLQFSEI